MYKRIQIDELEETLREAIETVSFRDDEHATLGVKESTPVSGGHSPSDIATIRYDGTDVTLTIHEKHVEREFSLKPVGSGFVVDNQATSPDKLAPKCRQTVKILEESFGVFSWDFTDVEAGSMGMGGRFCDFEFTWVATGAE